MPPEKERLRWPTRLDTSTFKCTSDYDSGGGGRVGTAEEELITEGEAARCLSVTLYQLRELSAQGRLQSITVQVPGGQVVLYYRGEVLRLSESLKGMPSATEDWPDVIDE